MRGAPHFVDKGVSWSVDEVAGDEESGAILEAGDLLCAALSESGLPQQQGPALRLEGSRKGLARAGRLPVHQHHLLPKWKTSSGRILIGV